MISRRNFFQFSGAAWMYFGGDRFNTANAATISPDSFDPIRAENVNARGQYQ
jgi:hypothetical protein